MSISRNPLPLPWRRFARQLPAWITLLLVLAALINSMGLALGVLPGWIEALLDALSSVAASFLAMFLECLPFLLLGALFSGIAAVFITGDEVARWMPGQPILAALAGALLGFFIPAGDGVILLTRRLLAKRMPAPAGIGLLLAAPALNPISLASMLAVFGLGPIFWGRLVLTLVTAVFAGGLYSLLPKQLASLASSRTDYGSVVDGAFEKSRFSGRLREALIICLDELFEFMPYFVLGALIAALLQAFTSRPALMGFGQGPLLSTLAMLVLSTIHPGGATSGASLALPFVGVVPAGALLAYLAYGSMLSFKNALMLAHVFRPRVVLYLVLAPLIMVLVAAVLVNVLGTGG